MALLETVTTTPRLADPETHALVDLVDLARYPIDRPGSPEWHGVVAHCTGELADDGFVSLPGFLRPDALAPVYGLAEASLAATFPEAGREYRSVTLDRHQLNVGKPCRKVERADPDAVEFMCEGHALPASEIRVAADDDAGDAGIG